MPGFSHFQYLQRLKELRDQELIDTLRTPEGNADHVAEAMARILEMLGFLLEKERINSALEATHGSLAEHKPYSHEEKL